MRARLALALLGLLAPVAAVGAALVLGGRAGDEAAPDTRERIGRFLRSQFLIEHDRFLPATDPRSVPAGQAAWLAPRDEVFGLWVGDTARAYPVPMLAYHHVVNDVLQGIPVAVTY